MDGLATHDASRWETPKVFGAFHGVPNREYHAGVGVSSSHLKRLAESPAHSQLPVEFSATTQRSIDVGTLVHGFVLERLTVEQMGFSVKPDGLALTTTDGKAWRKANPGPMVDAEQIATAEAVARAIRADVDARAVTTGVGIAELSLRAQCPTTGLILKARLDWHAPVTGWTYDIKTTSKGVSPEAFGKEIEERHYLLQAAHYLRVQALAGLDAAGFRFVAASTAEPYEVACYDFGPESEAWGRVNAHLDELYALHAECVRRNTWPKTPWGAQPVRLPAWSRYGKKRDTPT